MLQRPEEERGSAIRLVEVQAQLATGHRPTVRAEGRREEGELGGREQHVGRRTNGDAMCKGMRRCQAQALLGSTPWSTQRSLSLLRVHRGESMTQGRLHACLCARAHTHIHALILSPITRMTLTFFSKFCLCIS